jgi:transcriptional regulator with PAS, ATPase and Fis domain
MIGQMTKKKQTLQEAFQALKEEGLSYEQLIDSFKDKEKQNHVEIFNALTVIFEEKLYHWFGTETGIYDEVRGGETGDEIEQIVMSALIAVVTGIKETAKTEYLLRFAKSDAPVIIIGESGTGKDLLAMVIHRISQKKGPYIKINAAELSETLFESEMFGHTKGAFTSAVQEKKGLLEDAENGTFFLDELGKMPMPLQGKLLRVIEKNEIRKVGEQKYKKAKIRFIVAFQQGEIKNILPDLLSRLKYPSGFVMPSLNEELIKYGKKIILFAKFNVMKDLKLQQNTKIILDKDLNDYLVTRTYKLNYRELENILHHAIMNRNPNQMDRLTMSCLDGLLDSHSHTADSSGIYPSMSLSEVLSDKEELDRIFIEQESVLMTLDYKNFKYIDIFSFLEKIGRLIAQGMVMHISNSNVTFKKAFFPSGCTESEYQDFMKNVGKKLLKKNITEFAKEYKKNTSHLNT